MKGRRLLQEPGSWLLLALVVLMFRSALSGETFYFRDLNVFFYPSKLFLTQAVDVGAWPLWDSLRHGGQPYISSPSNSFFHPFNLLYVVLPPLWAFNLHIVLNYVAAAMAAYWAARGLQLGQAGSVVAAGIYVFSGLGLSAANLMVPLLHGLPFLPLSFGAVHRMVTRGGARWFVLAAVALGSPFMLGCTEMTAIGMATAALWVLLWPGTVAQVRARAVAFGCAVLLGIGLCMAQFVPAVELVRQSARGAKRSFASFTGWSIDVRRLPELVVPEFFGPTCVLDASDYWGSEIEDEGLPYVLSMYFGLAPLVLASAAVATRDADGPVPRRMRALLAALAAAAGVLALGRHTPLFRILYALPLVTTVRHPSKALYLALLPIALLAGLAVDRLVGAPGRRFPAWAPIGAACTAAAAWCAAHLVAAGGSLSSAVERRLFLHELLIGQRQLLSEHLRHAAAASAATAALLAWSRAFPRPLQRVVVAAFILLDLMATGGAVNHYAPRDFFDPPRMAGIVRGALGGGRMYRDPIESGPTSAPTQDCFWKDRLNIDVLGGYGASAYGIPVVLHPDYDDLAPRGISSMVKLLHDMPLERRVPYLRAAAATVVVTNRPTPSSELTLIGSVPSGPGVRIYIYKLDATRARFASRARFVATQDEAVGLAGQEPGTVALVGAARREGGVCDGKVVEGAGTPTTSSFTSTAACAGYLVVADTWFPGWHARVDGAPAEMLLADGAFRAVAVPAGTHEVVFHYVPRALYAGLALSVLTVCILAACLVAGRPRHVA